MNNPTVKLPQRSDMDLRIDLQWQLFAHATTPELRLAHCRKLNELVRERAALERATT